MELSGKTALITGGAKRIGAACAIALAKQGVDIALHYGRSAEAAETQCDRLRGLGVNAFPFSADLSDASACQTLVDRANQKMGLISILINCAAIFERGSVKQTSLENWQRHLDINLTAPFLLLQAFANQSAWLPNGEPPQVQGKVINFIDQRITRPQPGHLAYTTAKSALWAVTQMAAKELAPAIHVNGIAPGPILPAPDANTETFEKIARATPSGRPGGPIDITEALLFLLKQDYIIGEILRVDGGEHL
ncbi:MAG: SDR family oxidoreductase [Magnetococcales bacterium]|nr:SDR family oxidoreductase [Magnetococcales bacterium]